MKRAKKPKARPTENQLLFLEHMKQAGYDTRVCYGAEEAITAIEVYLKNTDNIDQPRKQG